MHLCTSGRVVALLMLTLASTSCARYSQANRQQRAYTKYVQKSQVTRIKQQERIRTKNETMPPSSMPAEMEPSEPEENVELEASDY